MTHRPGHKRVTISDPEERARLEASGRAGAQGVIGGREANIIVPSTETRAVRREEAAESAASLGAFQQRAEGQVPLLEQQQRDIESTAILKERGVFERTPAVREELDIEKRGPEGEGGRFAAANLPLIGSSISAGLSARDARGFLEDRKLEGIEPGLLSDPDTARAVALAAIQQDAIDEGISSAESFGSVIEGIPLVGSLANRYASGLIEDPKGNILTITTEIDSERERASVLAEQMLSGKIDPVTGLDTVLEIEDGLFRMEGRIKLLLTTSPALQADGDAVNKIEEKILRAKERVDIAVAAASGGVAVTPTDGQISVTLARLIREDKEREEQNE